MNNIQIFKYENNDVRTVEMNGEPWFVGNDVAAALGYGKGISELTVQNTIMLPKARYFDEPISRNTLTNFRETAKELGISEKAFIRFLIDKKYIFRNQRGKLMPYANRSDGWFEVKECYNEKTNWSGIQTLVTPKGRETFRLLCLKAL